MKIIGIHFLVLFISLNAISQKLSVSGGLNYSILKESQQGSITIPDYRTDWGYLLGIHSQFKLKKGFVTQFSLEHIQNSTKYNIAKDGFSGVPDPFINDIPLPGTDNDVQLKLNYIYFNPSVGYAFDSKVSVLVGPKIGYLLSHRNKVEGEAIEFTNEFKNMDYGLTGSVSFQITKNIKATTSYYYSLAKIEEYEIASLGSASSSIRNVSLGFSYTIIQ